MRRTITATAVAVAIAMLALAGCGGAKSSPGAAAASSQAASALANPTVSAELAQAKALVKTCFAGTPLQQASQVRLVFLSSATGKNGPAVVAARSKLGACLGIPEQSRTAFENDAITAAETQTPKIISLHPAAGVQEYLTVTLPQLVLKYKQAAGPTDAGSNDSPSSAPSAATS
jgi:hypothetical protein